MSHPLTIYKASAGSGKTFTLAVEYIRRLVCGPAAVFAYRETLAVTFTNKATTEMKDRIIEALYAIAHSLPSGEAYLKAIKDKIQSCDTDANGIETTIRERCRTALGYILHDYSRFRVETIDAFFQGILRDLAHELGLAAGLQTELDTAAATSEAVELIFDSLDENDRLRRQIASFVRQRIDEAKSWNVMAAVKSFARHIFDAEYQDAAPTLAPLLHDDDFMTSYTEKMEARMTETQDHVESCIDQLEYVVQEMGLEWSAFSYGNDIANHISKIKEGKQPDFGKRLQGFVDDPMKMLKKPDQKRPEMQEAAMQVSELLNVLQQMEAHAAIAKNTYTLIRRNLNELCLLSTIEERVNRLTLERGTFLLANTPQLLHRLVGDGNTPFIYEKMGARLMHVMLDEFQDTSHLQWNNFRTLLDDNMDRGGSTLVVGDVKQSIYRWRDGDWQILHGLANEMRHYNPQVVTLDTNYRSRRGIIDFNNRLYSGGAATELQLDELYADVRQLCPNGHEGGYVQLCYTKRDKDRQEDAHDAIQRTMQEMCHTIRELHEDYGVPYSEMAILIRNNSDEMAIAQAFDTLLPDVPLVSNGVFRLGCSCAVRMITDALRCLYDPTDKPAAYSLHFAYSTMVQGQSPDPNTLFLSGLPNAVDEMMTERDRLLRMPLYELVMHIVARFSINSISGQSAYLLTFYDQLSAYLNRHPANIGTFLDYYDEAIARATVAGCEVDGVGVLTIHKAKGLEWHTVFIPFANWPIERDQEMIWCSTHNVQPYCDLPLVPAQTGKMMAGSIFADDYEREHHQQRVDNLNLLYVATTRPGTNLFVWGNDGTRGRTVMNVIRTALDGEAWTTDEDTAIERLTFGQLSPYNASDKHSDNRMHPDYKAVEVDTMPCPALQSFKQSGAAEKFLENPEGTDFAARSYIEQGRLLHAVFEQLRTADDVQRVLQQLDASGLIESKEMRARVERLVSNGLSNALVASWFTTDAQVYNECTILTPDGEKRPDRVLLTDAKITVVDYKFGRPRDEHKTQVEEYMRLLQTMYPERSVEGFLWYVYQNKVERI